MFTIFLTLELNATRLAYDLIGVFIQVVESVEEPAMQYLHIAETEDPQGTETAVSALQDLRFNTQNGQKQLLQFWSCWISVKFRS